MYIIMIYDTYVFSILNISGKYLYNKTWSIK